MLFEVKKLDPVEGHPVEAFLRDIADKMGVDLDFSVKAGKELVFVEITGKDTGTIIGKRGATLDAVQCLASYVVNKENGKYTRVILDAENYRSKREKTLVNLANRLAGKVERTRRSVTLEPMNPYERKVIHCTLQNHPRVKTRSEGKDPYRKVIIELK
jgi:spoIIIJ-associated protein